MEIFQYGMIHKFGPIYNLDKNNCKIQPITVKKKPTAISLNNISGAFLILGLGLSSSLLVFLLEKIVGKFRKKRINADWNPAV